MRVNVAANLFCDGPRDEGLETNPWISSRRLWSCFSVVRKEAIFPQHLYSTRPGHHLSIQPYHSYSLWSNSILHRVSTASHDANRLLLSLSVSLEMGSRHTPHTSISTNHSHVVSFSNRQTHLLPGWSVGVC